MGRKIFRSAAFFLALLFVFGTSSSEAALSRQTASGVWSRIAQAAGLRPVPLQFDSSLKMNAWVKFESSSNYSVSVTQGLLNALESPSELAGILGHEAAHVTQGHYGKMVGRSLGLGAAAELINNSNNTLVRLLGLGGLLLAQSGFSREQEVEADDVGAQIAQRAGFDAWGLHNAMVRLRDQGSVTEPSGFNSHPPTERRLERLSRQAGILQANEKRAVVQARSGQEKRAA